MKLATGNPLIDESTAEWIVGSDEVGYGCWAGPLYVVAVALPRDWKDVWGVTDSKKLSASKREKIAGLAKANPPIQEGVWVSSKDIDEKGVWKCLLEAHRKALESVLSRVTGTRLVVIDGFPHGTQEIGVPGAIGLPKADTLVPTVSLASIIAKTTRDGLMKAYDTKYPGYGFGKHAGYGTPQHIAALEKLGVTPIHRKSYAPIARIIKGGTLHTGKGYPPLDELTEESEKLGLYP